MRRATLWLALAMGCTGGGGEETGTTETGDTEDTAPTDQTAPEVVSVTPTPNSVGVVTTAVVEVAFSEPLAPSSVGTDAVTLSVGNAPVAGAIEHLSDLLRFTPDAPLTEGATVLVSLSPDLADAAGNTLGVVDPTRFSVRWTAPEAYVVVAEEQAPVLWRIDLADGSVSTPVKVFEQSAAFWDVSRSFAISPDGQWVAVVADRRVGKLSAAGGEVIWLTDAAARVEQVPRWSAFGDHLAWYGRDGTGADGLYSVPVGGGPEDVVREGAGSIRWWSFSPDGTRLGWVDPTTGFLTVSEVGSGQAVVVSDRATRSPSTRPEDLPSWSRDSQRLAWRERWDACDESYSLCTQAAQTAMDVAVCQGEYGTCIDAMPVQITTVASGVTEALDTGEGALIRSYEWVDGDAVLWWGYETCCDSTLRRSVPGTAGSTQVSGVVLSTDGWAVSPDGKWVAYKERTTNAFRVASTAGDLANQVTLLDGTQGGATTLAWSPDSARLLTQVATPTEDPMQLWRFERDDSDRAVLTAFDDLAQMAWGEGWAGDSTWALYVVLDGNLPDPPTLRRVHADGTRTHVVTALEASGSWAAWGPGGVTAPYY